MSLEAHHFAALESAARAIGLTPYLEAEAAYWMNEVEREYDVTLGEFLDEWHNRHEEDTKAGWLDQKSLRVIRLAFIKAGIAIPTDDPRYRMSFGFHTWFRIDGKSYYFDPED